MHFNDIVLRTPLLPFKEVYDKCNNLFDIIKLYDNPTIKEAIYLASPTLYWELEKNIKLGNINENERCFNSLLKYLLRLASRSTPFGLFAGCSIVEVGTKTDIVLGEKDIRHIRLDTSIVSSIITSICKNEQIRNKFKYYSNNSLYLVSDEFRYIKRQEFKNKIDYKLTKVDNDYILSRVIEFCEFGHTIPALMKLIIDEGFEYTDAQEFCNTLIKENILLSELQINLTETNQILFILEKLNSIQDQDQTLSNIVNKISIINDYLDRFNKSTENIFTIIAVLKELLNEIIDVSIVENNIIQLDLFRTTIPQSIDVRIIESVSECIPVLEFLSNKYSLDALNKFTATYIDKYEYQSLPLMRVLDPEFGIGYPVNGIQSINEPLLNTIENFDIKSKLYDLTSTDLIKFQLLLKASKNNEHIIDISNMSFSNQDFEKRLPDTYSAIIQVYNRESALSENIINIKMFGGNSACNLLSRFSYLDNRVLNLCNQIHKFESENNVDYVLCEILHLPEAKTGNVLVHSKIRDYELPYLTLSSCVDEFKIKLSDITIKIHDNKIFLFSNGLKKYIKPKLSNAHNFGLSGLPIYRFLCDIQYQDISYSIKFDWGIFGNELGYYPRVIYKNIIFSLAYWNLNTSDLPKYELSDMSFLSIFEEWRNYNKIPKYVYISNGDNELTLDLQNLFHIKLLYKEVSKHVVFRITESLNYLPSIVRNNNSNYFSNEIILSFKNDFKDKNINYVKMPGDITYSEPIIKEKYIPSFEWIYFKIYCGNYFIDKILVQYLYKILKDFIEKNYIISYFYIRYNDPYPHLRLRLRCVRNYNLKYMFNEIKEKLSHLVNINVINNIQIDTYKPEIERYGINKINLLESLFCFDSNNVIEFLRLSNELKNVARWIYMIKYIDYILESMSLSLIDKVVFCKNAISYFESSIQFNPLHRKYFNDKYRSNKDLIIKFMNGELSVLGSEYQMVDSLINNLKIQTKEIFTLLNSNFKHDDNIKSAYDLIHLNNNRLFQSKANTYEYACYLFSYKYYNYLKSK